ncbi:hypothetical protein DFJ73DRAFT_837957 [Zopfochytrium polystomum]|nr:hypothetical protein DFJ73DRAFT_837957 [Zopfochytrium polystomum]
MDLQRKLLEELMNPLLGTEKDFHDPGVCKYSLAAFCPHDLFTNTKYDLGPCPFKIHDEKLCRQYQSSLEKGKLGYEQELVTFLVKLEADMDRAIRRAKERMEVSGQTDSVVDEEGEKLEKIVQVEEQIKAITTQVEEFGEAGEVEKAQELLAKVDSLKQAIEVIRNSGARRLMVCEVCSACLVANDSTARMDAHLIGKQHTGYLKIRQWLETWRKSGSSTSTSEMSRNSPGARDPAFSRQSDLERRSDLDRRGGHRGWGGRDHPYSKPEYREDRRRFDDSSRYERRVDRHDLDGRPSRGSFNSDRGYANDRYRRQPEKAVERISGGEGDRGTDRGDRRHSYHDAATARESDHVGRREQLGRKSRASPSYDDRARGSNSDR